MTLADSYIDRTEAETYAARVVETSAWDNATEAQQEAALKQATAEIDMIRWRGYPYDDWTEGVIGTQARAFPRFVPDAAADWPPPKDRITGRTWDWDDDENEAVVPDRVKAACYQQALSILRDPQRRSRLRDRHEGVSSQGAAGFSESYDAGAPIDILCLEARALLDAYRLKSGRIV